MTPGGAQRRRFHRLSPCFSAGAQRREQGGTRRPRPTRPPAHAAAGRPRPAAADARRREYVRHGRRAAAVGPHCRL